MNFEERTDDLIGSATGAKEAKYRSNDRTLGILGKRPERIEAVRAFLKTSLRRWTEPCTLCKQMVTRK